MGTCENCKTKEQSKFSVMGSRKEGGAGEGCECRAQDTHGECQPQPVPAQSQGKCSGGSCLLPGLLLGMFGAGATSSTSHTPTVTGHRVRNGHLSTQDSLQDSALLYQPGMFVTKAGCWCNINNNKPCWNSTSVVWPIPHI